MTATVALHPVAPGLPAVPGPHAAPGPLAPAGGALARLASDKLSTGVPRLDSLLGGGYSPGCATLLYGPPFTGKQQLQRQAVVAAVRAGVPTTVVLHTVAAGILSRRLRDLDPAVAAAEESGLLHYVDAHSRALGEPTDHPFTTYVGEPSEVHEALKASRRHAPGQRSLLVIESASTVLMTMGAARAFTYFRTILGRVLASGGYALLCVEGGMHPESDVQMAKHLCAGMIELRKKGEAHALHVEGLETAFARPGWVEYEFTSRSFKVTGSFATSTIR